jgi:hypothetical protein
MKSIISEGKLKGGLVDGFQAYRLTYLPPEPKYPDDKICLEHRIEIPGKEDARFLSLRFNNPAQLKVFLLDVVRALVFFKKVKKEINANNCIFLAHDLGKSVSSEFMRVLKESGV